MRRPWGKTLAVCAVTGITVGSYAVAVPTAPSPSTVKAKTETVELDAVERDFLWAAQWEALREASFGPAPKPTEDLTEVVPTPEPEPLKQEQAEPEESGQGKTSEPKSEPVQTPQEPASSSSITISGHVNCTGAPQPCIDAGSLTYYSGCWKNGECSQLIGGHDYMGWEWLNSVPLGTIVNVSGPGSGVYEVYDHMYINRQGGDMPSFGGAALVLQSCSGNGTAFSLLRRV